MGRLARNSRVLLGNHQKDILSPSLPLPLVQITFLTSWPWSCPLGLKLPFLNLTELCTAALGRGAVGAMADHLGLNVSLVTPSPWDMPGLDTVLGK